MTPEQELAKNNLDTFAALASVAGSEGGQILMKSLARDVLQSLDQVMYFHDEYVEVELRAKIARLRERFDLYKSLANADGNMRGAQEELDALMNP